MTLQRSSRAKAAAQDISFLVLMVAAVFLCLWKCKFVFAGQDEAFYFAITDRILKGDALFKDEWHLSLLSVILRMPFLALFRLFNKTNEGLLLAGRYAYVAIHTAICAALYGRLRKFGPLSVPAIVVYYLFSPNTLMTFSYYAIGLDSVVMTGALVAAAEPRAKAPYIVAGVFFACSVLCYPHMLAVYLLFAVLSVIRRNKSDYFTLPHLLWVTAGAAAVALAFFVLLFSRTSIRDILTYLPQMLRDPEHSGLSFFAVTAKALNRVLYFFWSYSLGIYILHWVSALICLLDKGRTKRRGLYLGFTALLGLALYYLIHSDLTTSIQSAHAILIPPAFIGLISFILLKDKKCMRGIFYCLYCLSILFGVAMCYGSNLYYYVFTTALAGADVASFLLFGQLLREMHTDDQAERFLIQRWIRYAGTAAVCAVLALMCAGQAWIKKDLCYWEKMKPSEMQYTLTAGPAKGLRTKQSTFESYEKTQADLNDLNGRAEGRALVLSEDTWLPLSLYAYGYGTYSVWLSGETDTTLDRLDAYFAARPENIPVMIYLPKGGQWNYPRIMDKLAKAYTVEENDFRYVFFRNAQ